MSWRTVIISSTAKLDYQMGYLEYRSVRFETELLDKPNFQGNAAVKDSSFGN